MNLVNEVAKNPAQVLLDLLNNTSPDYAMQLKQHSCSFQAQLLTHVGHILLMKEEVRAWHEDINQSLNTLSRSPSDVSQNLYSSPLFRSWLNQLATSLVSENQNNALQDLMGLWNSMTYLSEDTAEKNIRLVDGYLVTWDVQNVFKLDGDTKLETCKCSLRYDRENTTLHVSKVDAPVHKLNQYQITHSKITLSNANPLLRMKFNENMVPERTGTTYFAQPDKSVINFPANYNTSAYEIPYLLIKQHCPSIANDIDQYISIIIPRGEPKGWTIHGYTISSYQGACWITDHSIIKNIETLAHEMGHIKLRYLEELIPIFESNNNDIRFPVPWRSDERPLIGIFEGVYVHTIAATALYFVSQSPSLDTATLQKSHIRTLELISDVRYGLDILLKHSKVTSIGAIFYQWIEQQCSELELEVHKHSPSYKYRCG
uniref:aKG-HExxH-type peptide beta-hydroxylase n=1 Tax=Vibrio atypicus TaxID=558271 RepID=UPI00135C86E7|nr:HEXXH motif-containing putative peptide modification protein [Vibrio atypicus]